MFLLWVSCRLHFIPTYVAGNKDIQLQWRDGGQVKNSSNELTGFGLTSMLNLTGI